MKYMTAGRYDDGSQWLGVIFNLGTGSQYGLHWMCRTGWFVVNKLPPLVVGREGWKFREVPNMLMAILICTAPIRRWTKFSATDIQYTSELKQVNGGFCRYFGNREYAMRIWLKPDRMPQPIKFRPVEYWECSLPVKQAKARVKIAVVWIFTRAVSKGIHTKRGGKKQSHGELLKAEIAGCEFGSSMYDIYSNL